jgi:nucleoid-associated protein YgaU
MPSQIGSASPTPAGGAPAAPAASKGNTTYVVKKGDKGFWDIAEKVYGPGKGKYWTLIEKANKQVDYGGLKEGMTLTIPPIPEQPAGPVAAAATPPAAAATGGGGEKVYVVQAGDGWWSIARKEYGDGKYWEELRKANPQIQGNLKAGQKIKIPPLGPSGSASPTTMPSTAPKPTRSAPPPANNDRPIFD